MGETINRFTVWAMVAQGYGLGPELARDIVNERRDNDTWPTFALACVLARRTRAINEDISAGLAALECARNIAGGLMMLAEVGEPAVVADEIRSTLVTRARLFPGRWESDLNDAEISLLAAEGAQAWERASRTARAA